MEKITFVNNSEPYLSAENLNLLQDNVENAIGDTYSTEEQVIGTWIDGKHLYRKVLNITPANGLIPDSIVSNISNLNDVTKMECIIQGTSGQWRTIPWLYSALTEEWAGGFYFAPDSDRVYFQVGSALGDLRKGFMIIEYTKTTD